MFFHNISNNVVAVCIKEKKLLLQPNEKTEISVNGLIEITLKHLYGSASMSVQEIARDDADVSVVSAVLSSHNPPYFQVVLDSTYSIQGNSETLVQIQQQLLRPCYPCSYDRFCVSVYNGNLLGEMHQFAEKESFINIYKKATTKGTKKIVLIAVLVLVLFSLPVILGLWKFNHLLAIISAMGLVLVVCAVYLIAFLFSKLSNYVDKKTVLDNFESNVIAQYFANDNQDNTSMINGT